MDLYLRTKTKKAMHDALDAAGLIQTDEETGERYIKSTPHTSVHEMGHISKHTGTKTVDGEQVPTYTEVKKWHVNVRTSDQTVIDQLVPLDCAPKTPHCDWMD